MFYINDYTYGININLKFVKCHSKAKRRAPTYSRALRQIKGVVQRVDPGKLMSDFPRFPCIYKYLQTKYNKIWTAFTDNVIEFIKCNQYNIILDKVTNSSL